MSAPPRTSAAVMGLLLLARGQAVAGEPSLDAWAAVDGGWDANLNDAVDPEDRVGDLWGGAGGSLGISGAVGQGRLSTALRADHRAYLTYQDLSSTSVGASAGAFRPLGDRAILSLAPRLAWVAYRDDARSGASLGVSTAARLRLGDRASARAGYTFDALWAADDAFDRRAHTLSLAMDLRPWRGSDLYLEYGATLGQVVVYEESRGAARVGEGPGTGDGQGSASSTFGPGQLATSVPALTHAGRIEVEQELVQGLTIGATGMAGWVVAEAASFPVLGVSATVGVRGSGRPRGR